MPSRNGKNTNRQRVLLSRLEERTYSSSKYASALMSEVTGISICMGELTKDQQKELLFKDVIVQTLEGNRVKLRAPYGLMLIGSEQSEKKTVFIDSSLSPEDFTAEIRTTLCAIESMNEYNEKLHEGYIKTCISCQHCENKECRIRDFCKRWR